MISDRIAQREIVTGRRLNFKYLQAAFGEYIEARVDAEVNNDMKGRTHDGISLAPSGHWQGSQVCFDLETGKVVFRRTITRLPMTTSIIQVINNWVKSHKNADFNNKLGFWDPLKQKYDLENDDLDVTEVKVDSERVSQHMHIPAEIPGVHMESYVQPDIGAIQAPPVPTMS